MAAEDKPQKGDARPLIGREAELEALAEALREARLLSLLGIGGTGKTSLAAALVGRPAVQEAFPDGRRWVSLEPLRGRPELEATLAEALDAPLAPESAPVDALAEAIGARRLLLVLDGCEPVAGPCAELASALLTRCAGLTILATSRIPLGAPEERAWQVRPLALPEGEDADAVRRSAAGALFAARAAEARPGYEITDENAAAVAAICRRTDGLPLALALAASRVGLLGSAQLAARLEDAIGLLSSDAVELPPRQRRLQAVLDWSHEQLPEPARDLLLRTSVFASPFDLEAAEALRAEGPTPERALDELAVLRAHAQLEVLPSGGGRPARYRLLDPLRQHARAALAEQGGSEAARGAHLRYWRGWAEARFGLRGAGIEPESLDRCAEAAPDLRAALAWAREDGDRRDGQALAAAMTPYWQHRGFLLEGRGALEGLLDGDDAKSPERAAALHALARIAAQMGDHFVARDRAMEASALFGRLGRPEDRVGPRVDLSHALIWLGEAEAARKQLAAALAEAEEAGDDAGRARILHSLATEAQERGDAAAARAHFEAALPLRRSLGDTADLAITLNNLGNLLMDQEPAAARRHFAEALRRYEALEDVYGAARVQANLGLLETYEERWPEAEGHLRGALARFREIESAPGVCVSLINLSELLLRRGRHAEAIAALRALFDELDEERALFLLEESLRLAALALAREAPSAEDAALALQLLAAAEAQRVTDGDSATREDAALTERTADALEARLDPARAAAAREAGAALEARAALELARTALAERETRRAAPESLPLRLPDELSGPYGRLTPRETEVVGCVLRGLTNEAIAGELHIAVRTVETHLTKVMTKLDVQNRAQVAAWAARRGVAQEGRG